MFKYPKLSILLLYSLKNVDADIVSPSIVANECCKKGISETLSSINGYNSPLNLPLFTFISFHTFKKLSYS